MAVDLFKIGLYLNSLEMVFALHLTPFCVVCYHVRCYV